MVSDITNSLWDDVEGTCSTYDVHCLLCSLFFIYHTKFMHCQTNSQDDEHWFPIILRGGQFVAYFKFRGHETITDYVIQELEPQNFQSLHSIHEPALSSKCSPNASAKETAWETLQALIANKTTASHDFNCVKTISSTPARVGSDLP